MGKFCEQCGSQLKPGAAFCEACGARVKSFSANGNMGSGGTSNVSGGTTKVSAGNTGRIGTVAASDVTSKGKSGGVVAGIVLLLALFGGGWYYYQNYMEVTPTATVMDEAGSTKSAEL